MVEGDEAEVCSCGESVIGLAPMAKYRLSSLEPFVTCMTRLMVCCGPGNVFVRLMVNIAIVPTYLSVDSASYCASFLLEMTGFGTAVRIVYADVQSEKAKAERHLSDTCTTSPICGMHAVNRFLL